ncbi:MAG: hypothetical protein GX045_05960 [Clostridiaceae bacterium]|jgi:hypothetical protein|nr:hypothetical protein [Clostridiaceae bacterium]
MDLLIEYIIAMTNLYGMVSKEKAVEIYNSQNEDKVGIDVIESYMANPPEELEKAFIYPYKGYFVHEAILEFDAFDVMLAEKAGKPYYVPDKEELLKYTDEWYFEKTGQFETLFNYVRDNFCKGDANKAEELCVDIQGTCHAGSDVQSILDVFNDRGIGFRDIDHVNEVLRLVMDFHNNMRLWENNGHTPNEIFEMFEKPFLRPLPKKPFNFDETNVIDIKTRRKIGRNDPCPCGSGKKYKKCCGK